MNRRSRFVLPILALVALGLIVFGIPGLLIYAVGWPVPSPLPTIDEIGDVFAGRTPVPADYLISVLAIAMWVIWFQLLWATIIEAAAALRGRLAARARMLPGVQLGVAKLVTTATFLATSLAARPASSGALVPVMTGQPFGQPDAAATPREAVQQPAQSEVTPYVTQTGDTWWGIAETNLGSGTRWKEVRALNLGRTMSDGSVISASTDLLRPAWRLMLPSRTSAGAAGNGVGARSVTVERGDTIWGLAEDDLNTRSESAVAEHVAEISDLNRDQLNGNPDLIYPGQRLDLPPALVARPAPPDTTTAPETAPPSDDAGPGPDGEAAPTTAPAPPPTAAAEPATTVEPTTAAESATTTAEPATTVEPTTAAESATTTAEPATTVEPTTTAESATTVEPTTIEEPTTIAETAAPATTASNASTTPETVATSAPGIAAVLGANVEGLAERSLGEIVQEGAPAAPPAAPADIRPPMPPQDLVVTPAPSPGDIGGPSNGAGDNGGPAGPSLAGVTATAPGVTAPVEPESPRSPGSFGSVETPRPSPTGEFRQGPDDQTEMGPLSPAGPESDLRTAVEISESDLMASQAPGEAEELDTQSSRAPAFVGLAALTLVGGYLYRARGRRRQTALRHRHPGRRPSPPKRQTRTVARRLSAAAELEHPEFVNIGLRALSRQLRNVAPDRLPIISGVWVSHNRLVIALAENSPRRVPPEPFTEFADGSGWSLHRKDFDQARKYARGANGPLPLLTTVGTTTALDLALTTNSRAPAEAYGLASSLLFAIDLEAGRVISVQANDDVSTIEALTMMALELATSETADQAEIVCVGFGHRLATFDRVTVVEDVSDVLGDLETITGRAVYAAADASPFATRVGNGAADTWNPVIVFHADAYDPHSQTLIELAERTPGGVTAVCGYPTRSGWTLQVNGDRVSCPNLPGELANHQFKRPELDGIELIADLFDEPWESEELDDDFWQPMDPVEAAHTWHLLDSDETSWRPMRTVTTPDSTARRQAGEVADRGEESIAVVVSQGDVEREPAPEVLWDSLGTVDPDTWPDIEIPTLKELRHSVEHRPADDAGLDADVDRLFLTRADRPSVGESGPARHLYVVDGDGRDAAVDGDPGAAESVGRDEVDREQHPDFHAAPAADDTGSNRFGSGDRPSVDAPPDDAPPDGAGAEMDPTTAPLHDEAAAPEAMPDEDAAPAPGPGEGSGPADEAGSAPAADGDAGQPGPVGQGPVGPGTEARPTTADPAHHPAAPADPVGDGLRPVLASRSVGEPSDDVDESPPSEVRVSVLGNFTIEGHHIGDRSKPWKYTKTPELILYLLLHPAGASQDLLMEQLFPEQPPNRPRLNQLVSDARTKALGQNESGEYHLPHASPTEPFYKLLPSVSLDLRDFAQHCANARNADHIEVELREWAAALKLVRGRPFSLPHDGYEWAVPEIEATIIKVEEAAVALTDIAFEVGDYELAVWATKQGLLTGTGYYELLVKRGRAALLLQDPEEIVRAFADLQVSLEYTGAPEEGMPDLSSHPDLEDVYNELSNEGRSKDRPT